MHPLMFVYLIYLFPRKYEDFLYFYQHEILAVYSGYTIPPTYDSMIAKLIVHAQSRPACIMRAERALDEFVIEGVKTTIPLQKRLLENTDVRQLKTDNHWLEKFLENEKEKQQEIKETEEE